MANYHYQETSEGSNRKRGEAFKPKKKPKKYNYLIKTIKFFVLIF